MMFVLISETISGSVEAMKREKFKMLINHQMESGDMAERKELERLLEFVRVGDTVKVTKLCRLARNTKHLLEIVDYLDEKRVSLQVLNLGIDTSSPTGRLMLTMIRAVAAFERELLLERQAEGIAIAKAKGKYLGRRPTAKNKATQINELLKQWGCQLET